MKRSLTLVKIITSQKAQAILVPAEPVSLAVSLADKIDTLIGFWIIDEKPTGSKIRMRCAEQL